MKAPLAADGDDGAAAFRPRRLTFRQVLAAARRLQPHERRRLLRLLGRDEAPSGLSVLVAFFHLPPDAQARLRGSMARPLLDLVNRQTVRFLVQLHEDLAEAITSYRQRHQRKKGPENARRDEQHRIDHDERKVPYREIAADEGVDWETIRYRVRQARERKARKERERRKRKK